MISRSSLLRTSQLGLRQYSHPIRRNALQWRPASTGSGAGSGGSTKLVGPMDNAFNRERLAVREHAAQSADLWRKLCIYVVIPSLLLASINAKNLWDEHWEHWDHMPPLEDRVEYPYQNIRTKAFPWGDGDKTLFWNPKVNYHKKDK